MLIKKSRIRSLKPIYSLIPKSDKFQVGINDIERFNEILVKLGFTKDLKLGETILPSRVGPVSSYNAEGKFLVRRDLPMEKSYSSREWFWQEFNGPYDRVERSKIVDVPHDRYPREFISPPSLELTITGNDNKKILLINQEFSFGSQEKEITHAVNLLLEIFHECGLYSSQLEEIEKLPTIRLNWKILPPGEMPWEKLSNRVDPYVKKSPKGNQPVIVYRLKLLASHQPDFCALGQGGFSGYIVFGYSQKKIFALESIYYGNATYIFGEDWKKLSKLTKAEILNEKLQKDRLIHREKWDRAIVELLGGRK